VRARVPREKAQPFERLTPNAKSIRALKEARGKFKRFKRVEDLMIELKAKV
jgi:DNA-damage-inducible protein J